MAINEKGEFIRDAPARSRFIDSALVGNNISLDDWLNIAKCLGLLLLLAGFICLLIYFYEWIVIGVSIWIFSSLRQWLS
jgi:hypothetical protein